MGFKRLRDESFSRSLLRQPGVTVTLGRGGKTAPQLTDGNGETYTPLEAGNYIDIKFPAATSVDCIVLQEPIRMGQRVKAFSVQIIKPDGSSFEIRETTIGHKRILTFPPQQATGIRIRVEAAKAVPLIGEVNAFLIDENLVAVSN
jgi:alpha-L-fucosidase